MNIEKVVEEIILYYDRNRQVGHSSLLVNGLMSWSNFSETGAILVVTKEVQKKEFSNVQWMNPKIKIYTLSQIENYVLRGSQLPLVIDNDPLFLIMRTMKNKLDKNEQIMDEYRNMLYKDEPKFCKDCKHHSTYTYYTLGIGMDRCFRKGIKIYNLVSGEISNQYLDCDNERYGKDDDVCGPKGKYWEAR
jgi:hypothetical protein